MACTIGAKIIQRGEEYVLFKNKDLARETFEDVVVTTSNVFGVRGIHLPAGGGRSEDVLSGFSVGVNRSGVSACNSHVKSIEAGLNYDDLTEAAVDDTLTSEEACQKVVALARQARYNWCNILVADPCGAAMVEIAEDVARVTRLAETARSNRHLLRHAGRDPEAPDARCRRAELGVQAAVSVADFSALLRSHEGREEKSNLCAHGTDRTVHTVYSYIVHWTPAQIVFYVCRGNPCAQPYTAIPLAFPLDRPQIMRLYPTAKQG